jgi:hypothetical protein
LDNFEQFDINGPLERIVFLSSIRARVIRNESISSRISDLLARVADWSNPQCEDDNQLLQIAAQSVRHELDDLFMLSDYTEGQSFADEMSRIDEDPEWTIKQIRRFFDLLAKPNYFDQQQELNNLLKILNRAAHAWSRPRQFVLSPLHAVILKMFARCGTSLIQVELMVELDQCGNRRARATVSRNLIELREAGYVENVGRRKGDVITQLGQQKLDELINSDTIDTLNAH